MQRRAMAMSLQMPHPRVADFGTSKSCQGGMVEEVARLTRPWQSAEIIIIQRPLLPVTKSLSQAESGPCLREGSGVA